MSSRSYDSEPSFYTAIPNPCDKCRFTTCFSLHSTAAASSCTCPDCRELEILDAQIADAHDLLVNLSQKRHRLKVRINCRHDPLSSRLPVEIISYIFNLATTEPDGHSYGSDSGNPVVQIGAVCKLWRDITLGTPQLWTNIVINPWDNASSSLETAQQWPARSRSLPLSLKVHPIEDEYRPSESNPHSHQIIQLLRSQASRWKDLTLYLSKEMFRNLLNGLEDRMAVDSLRIFVDGVFRAGMGDITMAYPLAPKILHICNIPVSLIPVLWDRLTHLTTYNIRVDELLYIFRSAPNLQDCDLDIAEWSRDSGHYPIPVATSINESVTCLKTEKKDDNSRTTHFIQNLTLPSLKTLFYGVTYTEHREELGALIDFLDRSHSPLHAFYFFFHDKSLQGPSNIDWYWSLSTITTLDVTISLADYGQRLQAYIQGLKADLVPLALPRLQELKISAHMMNLQTWDALAEIFPNDDRKNDTDNHDASPVVSRPLKTVTMFINHSWEDQEIMCKSTFDRLRNIRESGVQLVVFDEDGIDLLDPCLRWMVSCFAHSVTTMTPMAMNAQVKMVGRKRNGLTIDAITEGQGRKKRDSVQYILILPLNLFTSNSKP